MSMKNRQYTSGRLTIPLIFFNKQPAVIWIVLQSPIVAGGFRAQSLYLVGRGEAMKTELYIGGGSQPATSGQRAVLAADVLEAAQRFLNGDMERMAEVDLPLDVGARRQLRNSLIRIMIEQRKRRIRQIFEAQASGPPLCALEWQDGRERASTVRKIVSHLAAHN